MAPSYMAEMALYVLRLLDHLGIKKAHIIGYAMGAQKTAELLTMQPDRFLTATLAPDASVGHLQTISRRSGNPWKWSVEAGGH